MSKITDNTDITKLFEQEDWRHKTFYHEVQPKEQKCLHESCQECNGTGIKKSDGNHCIHMISCNCPRCTPYSSVLGRGIVT